MAEEMDNIHDFEADATSKKLPLGWLLFYVGLILWGIYYVAMYTPAFSGWSQEKAYTESVK